MLKVAVVSLATRVWVVLGVPSLIFRVLMEVILRLLQLGLHNSKGIPALNLIKAILTLKATQNPTPSKSKPPQVMERIKTPNKPLPLPLTMLYWNYLHQKSHHYSKHKSLCLPY
jgi:hypothetical protein